MAGRSRAATASAKVSLPELYVAEYPPSIKNQGCDLRCSRGRCTFAHREHQSAPALERLLLMSIPRYWPILFVATVGLVMMLIGLTFLRTAVVAIPLTGVGGSILATAIVNWLLTRRLDFLPLDSIIEALAQKVHFVRMDHEAEVSLSIDNGLVRLEKRHRYRLRNPSRFVRTRVISMFTDDSPSTDIEGGFLLVIGPDGNPLQGEELKPYITHPNGKHMFSKAYDLQPGDKNAFEFRSFDYYRTVDRLIWTVQDLADDFRIRIRNNTGMPDAFTVKINHHREEEIFRRRQVVASSNETLINFDCEVLPYQGFEVMWKFDGTSTGHGSRVD